jgi:WD40 repeat protein
MSVVFSPDGRRLAAAGFGTDTTAKVWDDESGQETLTLTGHTREVWSVAFSPDGQRLASASEDGTAKVWDAGSGQETFTLKGHTGGVMRVVFSPDGRWIASASRDTTVKVWDTRTGQEILTLKGHTSPAWCVAFSPDGRWIASASLDRTVKVWDTRTGQEILTLKGHTREVESVAFSPDGRRLASASADRTVKVWDTRTGQEILTLKGHTWGVTGVVFSPDGERLASASADRTVKVWDTRTGQETLTLKGHTEGVESVAFSLDGQRLASASYDGTVKVWDGTPMTPESLARDDALRLIRFQIERITSEAELRDRIAGDKTISQEIRATALKLVDSFWATRIRGQAESLVSSSFARLHVRADVLDSVRADPTINPEVRATALALAETWPESAWDINSAAWSWVKLPNRPEANSRRGLRLAEAACQLEPNNGAFLSTLGVGQYRTGQYENAQATLKRSNELQGNRHPSVLAFLAMAQHRLDRVAAARATLQQLREVMKDPAIAADTENQGFLREAEMVILNAPELPDEVFAP